MGVYKQLKFWEHKSEEAYWNEIPKIAKSNLRAKFVIKDNYHTMRLFEKNDSSLSKYSGPLYPLKDSTLKEYYGYPNIGMTGKYLCNMGWDITCTSKVTESVDYSLEIKKEKLESKDENINIELNVEPNSIINIYLTTGAKNELKIYGIYGYPKMVNERKFETNIDTSYDIYESLTIPDPPWYDLTYPLFKRIWITTHRITEDGVKRGQKNYIISFSTSNTLFLAGEAIDVRYNEYSPDNELASEIINDPEETPLQDITETVILLIGGPVTNAETAKYQEYFPLKVTNDYPGEHMGVIEVIDNPFGEGKIVLLAGSDREGTEAAVEIFKTLGYLPDESIIVDWNGGDPIIVER